MWTCWIANMLERGKERAWQEINWGQSKVNQKGAGMRLERSGGKQEGYCSVNTTSQQHRGQMHCPPPSSALSAQWPQILPGWITSYCLQLNLMAYLPSGAFWINYISFTFPRLISQLFPEHVLLTRRVLSWSLQPKTHFSMQSAVFTSGSNCWSQWHWGGGKGESTWVIDWTFHKWTSLMGHCLCSVVRLVGQSTTCIW